MPQKKVFHDGDLIRYLNKNCSIKRQYKIYLFTILSLKASLEYHSIWVFDDKKSGYRRFVFPSSVMFSRTIFLMRTIFSLYDTCYVGFWRTTPWMHSSESELTNFISSFKLPYFFTSVVSVELKWIQKWWWWFWRICGRK